jgi:hypothetical protein
MSRGSSVSPACLRCSRRPQAAGRHQSAALSRPVGCHPLPRRQRRAGAPRRSLRDTVEAAADSASRKNVCVSTMTDQRPPWFPRPSLRSASRMAVNNVCTLVQKNLPAGHTLTEQGWSGDVLPCPVMLTAGRTAAAAGHTSPDDGTLAGLGDRWASLTRIGGRSGWHGE